jgi:hypothetical protein
MGVYWLLSRSKYAVGGIADIAGNSPQCPLLTQSGHEPLRIAALLRDPGPHSAERNSLL